MTKSQRRSKKARPYDEADLIGQFDESAGFVERAARRHMSREFKYAFHHTILVLTALIILYSFLLFYGPTLMGGH